MIKFKQNQELDETFRLIMESIHRTYDMISHISKYKDGKITPEIESTILKKYKEYGINIDSLKQDVSIVMDNSYFKTVKLNKINHGTIHYDVYTIKKNVLVGIDFLTIDKPYLLTHEPVGYFDASITLPVLKQNNKVWMSPSMSEIKSIENGVKKGHGKCLTFGLGIGFIAHQWLMKDNVESVTVVEYNKDVIDVFEKYIRPQLDTDKELEIIHGDAFDYYNDEFMKDFDYIYVDFWENNDDGFIAYTNLINTPVNLEIHDIDFWIENTILYDTMISIAIYLETLYRGRSVSGLLDRFDDESTRTVLKKSNRFFKSIDVEIEKPEELYHYINDKKVIREILRTKLGF